MLQTTVLVQFQTDLKEDKRSEADVVQRRVTAGASGAGFKVSHWGRTWLNLEGFGWVGKNGNLSRLKEVHG